MIDAGAPPARVIDHAAAPGCLCAKYVWRVNPDHKLRGSKVFQLRRQAWGEKDNGKNCILSCEKRKADDGDINKDLKKAKLETKALKAKRPGFTDDRYNETSYYIENESMKRLGETIPKFDRKPSHLYPDPAAFDAGAGRAGRRSKDNVFDSGVHDRAARLRKVYPYYFTFTTFTKGRWVGERILDVFAREFRAHPAAEYERCIRAGTLTVNYERVDPDYRLKHNDLLANVVHSDVCSVSSRSPSFSSVTDLSLQARSPGHQSTDHARTYRRGHCGRQQTGLYPLPLQYYRRHVSRCILYVRGVLNAFARGVQARDPGARQPLAHHTPGRRTPRARQAMLAAGSSLRSISTQHRRIYPRQGIQPEESEDYSQTRQADVSHDSISFTFQLENDARNTLPPLLARLLLFGRSPKKARQMEHQIRNRQVQKEYVCRVDGEFPGDDIECQEPIEVVSYKIGVCKVSPKGKECSTLFKRLGFNPKTNTSVVLCRPKTGRMHQIRVHLQYLGYPVVNDPLYNHPVFGPLRGRGGDTGGKSDEQLVRDLIAIHNAENWLGVDAADDDLLFSKQASDDKVGEDDDTGPASRESSPRLESPAPGLTPSNVITATMPSPSSGAEAPTSEEAASSAEASGSPTCAHVASSAPSPALNEDSNDAKSDKVTVATQTGCEATTVVATAPAAPAPADPALATDPHCYECRVRYRDPRPRDLVMYLHAWKYKDGSTKPNCPSGPTSTGRTARPHSCSSAPWRRGCATRCTSPRPARPSPAYVTDQLPRDYITDGIPGRDF
ncbi:RNA pseudouridylate synthase domain-containing protein 2 [Eumeta japonica]|uniref:RNA pseudouridylate synthase domain-containing protein 2 n=1 Tax=Eumeta variegata TaxID=151549 RepID=A0A4C1Z852_EUMVA|nr:RNA pseudouridylate synthase domain-containing protein 2 [Eumeta japonica]